jgi:hypothetical protein
MKISMKIAFVLVFLNSGAEMLRASGVADAMGIDASPGATGQMEKALDAAASIEPGGGFGETLFAMYVSVTRTFYAIFEFIFAAPSMLSNMGMPDILVAFIFAPLMLIVARDTAYLLIGRTA